MATISTAWGGFAPKKKTPPLPKGYVPGGGTVAPSPSVPGVKYAPLAPHGVMGPSTPAAVAGATIPRPPAATPPMTGSNAGANTPTGPRGITPAPPSSASSIGANTPTGPRGVNIVPPAPGSTTSSGVVPLTPGSPEYWAALIHADPRWLAAAPGFASRRGQAYSQYGFAPDASGALQVDTSNPFSAAGAYKGQLGNDSESAQNAANARGVLFSGAQVAAQQGAQNTYQQNLFNALKALQGILSGVSTDESNLYGNIYGSLKSTLPPGGKAS